LETQFNFFFALVATLEETREEFEAAKIERPIVLRMAVG
jgi:hypothetical protein